VYAAGLKPLLLSSGAAEVWAALSGSTLRNQKAAQLDLMREHCVAEPFLEIPTNHQPPHSSGSSFKHLQGACRN
jgi:hypothetical protein